MLTQIYKTWQNEWIRIAHPHWGLPQVKQIITDMNDEIARYSNRKKTTDFN
jgi:hypothetical protein